MPDSITADDKLGKTSQTFIELDPASANTTTPPNTPDADTGDEDANADDHGQAAGHIEILQSSSAPIRVVKIRKEHLPQVRDILKEAFDSKRCMLCLPVAESIDELQQRYDEMPQDKWDLGAVAIDDKGKVLGYTQMTAAGLPVYPEDFHTCESDELYIEIVAVSPEARGRGIGTKLLEWCHDTAKSASHTHISHLHLEVLRGNRAINLYERFGFEIKPIHHGYFEECCGVMLICCFFGRPYGLCHREWGSVEMEMYLEREQEAIMN